MREDVVKGFLAGMLISMGCIIYIMCTSNLLGSFLFSFGLFAILHLKLNLYTGKIGYLVTKCNLTYIKELFYTLLGNLLGALFTALAVRFTRLELTLIADVVNTKVSDDLASIFILSFFCGILMFLGVDLFNNSESYLSKILSVVFSVMIFILSGFENCIANMFYFFFVGNYNVLWLLTMILGNTCGSIFFCYFLSFVQKKK